MTKKIHKYILDSDEVTLSLPLGTTILTVQAQHGLVCLWALLEAPHSEMMELRTFRVVPTGVEFTKPETPEMTILNYIGTIQLDGGNLIYHVFEIRTVG